MLNFNSLYLSVHTYSNLIPIFVNLFWLNHITYSMPLVLSGWFRPSPSLPMHCGRTGAYKDRMLSALHPLQWNRHSHWPLPPHLTHSWDTSLPSLAARCIRGRWPEGHSGSQDYVKNTARYKYDTKQGIKKPLFAKGRKMWYKKRAT